MANFNPAPDPPTELGRLRTLAPSAGIRVSPLQLGGMSLGDAWNGSFGTMDKDKAFELLDAFEEAGGNFIDTANSYQNEQSEQWIGEWMAARKNRDRMVVATKFTSDYRGWDGLKGRSANFMGNHKKSIHNSIHDSLRKLQTDYVDILYLHWWDHTTSIPEVMDTLQILVEQGKVLYLGISDSPAWIVSAANTYAASHGKTPFSIYQGRWNVLLRDFEREIIPMARHFGMALAPWDVLASGRFQTEKVMAERAAAGGEGYRGAGRGGEQTEEQKTMSRALCKVAAEHGIESPTAVALAYVMSKAANVFPIIGGRKIEHLKDNIQALSLKLTDAQIEELEKVKEFQVGFPSNFMSADPKITGHSVQLFRANKMKFPNAHKPTSL